jgi:hypothetical protein
MCTKEGWLQSGLREPVIQEAGILTRSQGMALTAIRVDRGPAPAVD